MMTLEIDVMTQHVPALKGSAKELEIDLIVGEIKGDRTVIHVMIFDYYQLILLGHIAGVNSSYNSTKSLMGEFIGVIERKIADFKSKDNQNEDNSGI